LIKEVIVVEGRDDISAVKKAVDAEVIATGGFSLPPKVMERIKHAAKKKGIIIFTDPDYAGEKIRKTISSQIPDAKHAFLSRAEATKDGDIGIENATPKSIIKALEKVRTQVLEHKNEFSIYDLLQHNLAQGHGAGIRRAKTGEILGIGYGNSKQFLSRLNNYGVTREEFEKAIEVLEVEENEYAGDNDPGNNK
jgi:ribonuclease M5